MTAIASPDLWRSWLTVLALSAALAAAPADGASAEPLKVAVFDLELYDTSLEGEMRGRDPAETARLAELSDLLRDAVVAREDMETVDTTSLRARLETMPALYSCNGCEMKLARELGATHSISGYVSKVSTLILHITLVVRDAEHDRLLGHKSVSIRGNTDESWRHGLKYLLKTQILTTATQ
ncbi:MAG: DUF3280 domain-containing protein [Kiloniellaceae bacterium]